MSDANDWAAISSEQDYLLKEAHKKWGLIAWNNSLTEAAPDWLVPGLLQRAAIHVLSSESGCGKTWLGLNLMLSGIYGIPTLGQLPDKPFSSIYLAADSPRWDIGQQLRKLMAAHHLTSPAEPTSYIMPYGFLFDRQDHLEHMANLIRSLDIDAFFVDVMLYSHEGDENDNAYMARTVLRSAKYLRDELGVAVFFLHHNAKPKPDMPASFRGAGTIVQAAEHHFSLARRGDNVGLTTKKVRGDNILPETVPFRLQKVGDHGRKLVLLDDETNQNIVVRIMQSYSQPMTRGEIIKAIQSNPDRIAEQTTTTYIDNQMQYLRRTGRIENKEGKWHLCNSQ
jgi:hypothetical protein